MRGFILAAGFGTRLKPITDHLPKALVPLAGKPVLGHALDFLARYGITRIGVNTHYLPDRITAYRATVSTPFELFHETPAILGTGGALRFARTFLEGDDTFIVINADIVSRFDLATQLRRFEASGDCCRLLARRNSAGTGTIRFDPQSGRYSGAAAEADGSAAAEGADFIGMTLYRREFLDLLTPDDFSILPVWRRAAGKGMGVTVGLIDSGYWVDIGSPGALAQAHFDIIDGRLDIRPPPSLQIDRSAEGCFPAQWTGRRSGVFGRYCWIADAQFAPEDSVEYTVVFPDAIPCPSRPLRRTLLTAWGEVPFNE